MRRDRRGVYLYRAVFGAGFVVLGAVTLWRVAIAPAPPASKLLGIVFGLALIGLGAARIVQYLRSRRGIA
jgi:hypothetical protein